MTGPATLRPIGLIPSLLAFGLPALAEYLVVWKALPWLDRAGTSLLVQFAVGGTPLLALFVAALVLYRAEGNPWTRAAFRRRLRLERPDRKTWGWIAGLAVGGVGLYLVGAFAVNAVIRSAAMPEAFEKALGDQTTFVGHRLEGNWWLLGVWFAFYLVNVLGEELWFRGMVLPRQEPAFGRATWAVHGLCWAGWHVGFFPADVLVLLPAALAYGWVSQHARSTWPALAAHALLNSLAAIRLVLGIVG